VAAAPPPRVALIGFMGAGKSTIGRQLAARLGYAFVDVDQRIEARSGRTIRAIFAESGEEAFRRLASQTLAELATRRRVVIASGGGAPARPENRGFFLTAATFYLEISFEEFLRRTASSPVRPLRSSRSADELRALFERRQPVYRELGKPVRSEGRSPREIVEEILELLGQP